MQKLYLPEFEIEVDDGKVFCLIRKKWLVLTPEEWVRQHFIHLLISTLNYPRGMMKLEHAISYFKNQKRSDITVLDRENGVFLLVECKAPSVAIDQKVVNQVAAYNKVLNAQYMAVSNGLKHFIWQRTTNGLKQIQTFPVYERH